MPNEKEINRLVMMGAFVTGPRTKFLEKKMERIKSKKKVTKERACSDPNPPAMGHFSGSLPLLFLKKRTNPTQLARGIHASMQSPSCQRGQNPKN